MTNQYALGYKAALDAAVKVLREQARKEKNWHKQELLRQMANYIDIALPVPEVQWRDLTDDELEELQDMKFSRNDWILHYTHAVIAKFKEKQL